MPNQRITDMPITTTYTGAEWEDIAQGGVSKRISLDNKSDVLITTVSTVGDIVLNGLHHRIAIFTALSTIGADKAVSFAGTRLHSLDFIFEVTVEDIELDFGDNTRSPHANFTDGVWIAQDVGLYKVHATRYGPGGTLWLLDFNGVYSVGDAPPEPPTCCLETWDSSEVWTSSCAWNGGAGGGGGGESVFGDGEWDDGPDWDDDDEWADS